MAKHGRRPISLIKAKHDRRPIRLYLSMFSYIKMETGGAVMIFIFLIEFVIYYMIQYRVNIQN